MFLEQSRVEKCGINVGYHIQLCLYVGKYINKLAFFIYKSLLNDFLLCGAVTMATH